MRKHIIIIFVIGLIGTSAAHGQSPLGTGKGSGSINFASQTGLNGFAEANFAQPSFTIAFRNDTDTVNAQRALDHKARPHAIPSYGMGFGVTKVTAGSNSGTLWNGDNAGVGGTATASVTIANLATGRYSVDESNRLYIAHDMIAIHDQVIAIGLPDVKATDIPGYVTIARAEVDDISSRFDAMHPPDVRQADTLSALHGFCDVFAKQADNITAAIKNLATNDRVNAVKAITDAEVDLQPKMDAFEKFKPDAIGPGGLTWDSVSLTGEYIRDQYTLLNTSAAFSSQVMKRGFDGWSIKASYNAQWGQLAGGPVIFGIAGGVQRKNNSDSLKTVSVQDTIFTSTGGGTTRSAVKTTSALSGVYTESTEPVVDLDFIVKPKSLDSKYRLGLDFFTRSNYSNKNLFNPGVALFLSPPGEPLNVSTAITVIRNDSEKTEVDLVLGSNF